jgi:hypothetical protein
VRGQTGNTKPGSFRRFGKRVTIPGKGRLRHGSSSQPVRKQSPGLYIMNNQGRAAEQPAALNARVNSGGECDEHVFDAPRQSHPDTFHP